MSPASPDQLPQSDSTVDETTSKLVSHIGIEKDLSDGQNGYDSGPHHGIRRSDSWESMYERCIEYLDRIWGVELGCIVIAAIAMIAVAILLRYLDGLSLRVWTSKISPNTVLSILAAVGQGAMLVSISASFAQLRWCHFVAAPRALLELDLYDDASRGSWGSAMFVFQMVFGRHTVSRVACLGALLTALAVVIDPSIQQLLEYRTTAVPSRDRSQTAIMPVSHGPSHGANILSDKQAWQALYGGFLDFDFPLPFTCSSGNCTWPAFASLGICSECQDALPFATKQCASASNASHADDDCTRPVYSTDDSKLVMNLQNGTQATDSSDDTKTYTLIKSVVTGSYPNGLHDPIIFKFLIAQLDVKIGTDANAKQFSVNPNWNLTQCAIRWCSRAYESASVINGDLIDQEPTVVEVQVESSEACGKSLCQTLDAARCQCQVRIDPESSRRQHSKPGQLRLPCGILC